VAIRNSSPQTLLRGLNRGKGKGGEGGKTRASLALSEAIWSLQREGGGGGKLVSKVKGGGMKRKGKGSRRRENKPTQASCRKMLTRK